jgi:hypothetical protein
MSFIDTLRNNGWEEVQESACYKKGSWKIVFDTSSWIEVGTINTPRIFDVAVPEPHLENWTINLIEHLCKTDDLLVDQQLGRAQ